MMNLLKIEGQIRQKLALLSVLLVQVVSPEGSFAVEPPDVSELLQFQAMVGNLLRESEKETESYRRRFENLSGNAREYCYSYRLQDDRRLIDVKTLAGFQTLSAAVQRVLDYLRPVTDLQREIEAQGATLQGLKIQQGVAQAAVTKASDELAARVREKDHEARTLQSIQAGQRSAMRDWLTREYAKATSAPAIIRLDANTIVASQILFGAFVVHYPNELKAREGRTVTVTFQPAPLVSGLFEPGIDVWPVGYSRSPAKGLRLETQTVQTESGLAKFQLGQRQRVSLTQPSIWTWGVEAAKEFEGAEFDISMVAGVAQPSGPAHEHSVARLPVDLRRPREKGFWDRVGEWTRDMVIAVVGAAVGAAVPLFIQARSKRTRRSGD